MTARARPSVWIALAAALGLVLPCPRGSWAEPIPKPSASLLRSLDRFEKDLQLLDQTLPNPAPGSARTKEKKLATEPIDATATGLLASLEPPAPGASPSSIEAVRIQRRVRLSLPMALEVAVRNDPELAEQVAAVRERQGWLTSVRGRFWPELSLLAGSGYSQRRTDSTAWQGNESIPQYQNNVFSVSTGGWNQIQQNLQVTTAGLGLNWELVSFERNAALAESKDELKASQQRYANRLRQLQLDVSLAYYGLQLAEQLTRVRQAVVNNDATVKGEVSALKRSGLVPRLDLLRADAALQQSNYRLEQADALRLSRQRQISNLINVPFDVTVTASETVALQPPWPLDLEQTLIQGFAQNPQMLALQAARNALINQANRRAAELLPSLRLFAQAGYGEVISDEPLINLNGCCGATHIPSLYSQSADWAAGLQFRWRLFDGGVTSGAASASRAAAERTEQALARERNGIRQRMEAAFFDHRAALRQIVASRSSYAAAREAFRDVRARYQLGLANYTDVSQTIQLLTQTMESVAESITLANVSYAQLLRELITVPNQPGAPVNLPLVLPQPAPTLPSAAGAAPSRPNSAKTAG